MAKQMPLPIPEDPLHSPDGEDDSLYKPPTSGWLSMIDPGWHPYFQLMRIDRLHAALYFLIPQLAGCLQGAIIGQTAPYDLLIALSIILLWTFFFRGATCAWNDIVDVRFDAQVKRTRHRPLARGAISVTRATIFTAILTLCAMTNLIWLPQAAQGHGMVWILGSAIYPFSKRVTWFPQLVCGVVLAWGVLFGASILSHEALDIFPLISGKEQRWDGCRPTILLYLSNITWSVFYETIYSYADVKDDTKAGVKNIALLMPKHPKIFLSVLAITSFILAAANAYHLRASWFLFLNSVFGFAVCLVYQLYMVDLREPASCLKWFMLSGATAGSCMILGLLGEYFMLSSL